MASSVDGLVSGLSTSTLISQLMQAESLGQNKLKARVSTEQKAISAFQSINTRIASLKTAAATMVDTNTWKTAKASASSDAVSVSAGTGASTGQLTFDVKRLASANVQTAGVPAIGSIQDGTGLKITIGDTTKSITVTTDTAQGVADAINGADAGVRAAVISTEQGSFLQLTAAKTGAANAFTVSGLNVGLTTLTAGTDAQLAVGTVGAGGYTLASDTNTFTNVLPNVSVTAKKVESGVTVSVASDVDAMASKMQAMVDTANGLLTELGNQSAYKTGGSGGTAAPLTGNSLVRKIHSDVLSAVSGGLTDYGSFSQLGVQTGKDGKLTFDKDKFVAAYKADPTKIQNAVVNGLAKSLQGLAESAGTSVTSAIQSGNDQVKSLNKQVDDWDIRLNMRQEALQKQFTNLEVALGKMKEQSNWLAGQIASLG